MSMTLQELALEVKGVRRVRTPAGVAYFKQPIGTIITRDMREAAKARKHRKKTAPKKTPTKRPRRASGESGPVSGPSLREQAGRSQRISEPSVPEQFRNTRHYNSKEYAAGGKPKDPAYPRYKSPEASKALREMPMGGKIGYTDMDGKERFLEKAPGQAPWDTPFLKTEDGDFLNGQHMSWQVFLKNRSLNNVVHFPHLDGASNRADIIKKAKTQTAGTHSLNGKPYRITKADEKFVTTKFLKDKKTGKIFVVSDGTPVARFNKNGAKSIRADIIEAEFESADLVDYNDEESVPSVPEQPTLAQVANKPAKKSGKKIAPSKDTAEYIQEMKDFHDNGFAHFDAMLGEDRYVGTMADLMADRYDRRVSRIEQLLIEEDVQRQAYEEGDVASPDMPSHMKDELRILQDQLPNDLKLVNRLIEFAELDRDLTEDDLTSEDQLVLSALAGGLGDKTSILTVLNHKTVAPQAKDKNGRSIPPQELLDARDDIVDLGISMLKEIRQHQKDDPGVQAALAEYNAAQGTPKPVRPPMGATPTEMGKFYEALSAWQEANGGTSWEAEQERKNKVRAAKKKLAIEERRVKLEYLNAIRPMGPHPDATPKMKEEWDMSRGNLTPNARNGDQDQWDRNFEEALSIFPTSWIAAMPTNYYHRAWSDRAYHAGPPVGSDGENPPPMPFGKPTIAFRGVSNHAGNDPDLATTSFSSYQIESAAHELGHGFEIFVPGITAVEWAETYHRSGRNRPDGEWEKTKSIYGNDEMSFADEYTNIYGGKRYDSGFASEHKQHGEQFTTGIQDTFGRVSLDKTFTKAGDDSQEAMVLGLMATMHYYDDEEGWRS